jgi:hypothetical protein
MFVTTQLFCRFAIVAKKCALARSSCTVPCGNQGWRGASLRSHMLSTDHIKQLLNDSSFTDEQIEEIRDACRVLAELMFEAWRRDDLTRHNG